MRRGLAWLFGALGLAAVWRFKRRATVAFERPQSDPAEELRERLEQARETTDDRDEYDAAEGQPVDQVDEPGQDSRSIDERRRAIHDQAQEALGEMQRLDGDE
ncbi:MAG TPA: hypothetical protein VM049_12930 [Gaiellaceae bacterium]|nr:hypothetical protein [Gaiellaceae bacterium]